MEDRHRFDRDLEARVLAAKGVGAESNPTRKDYPDGTVERFDIPGMTAFPELPVMQRLKMLWQSIAQKVDTVMTEMENAMMNFRTPEIQLGNGAIAGISIFTFSSIILLLGGNLVAEMSRFRLLVEDQKAGNLALNPKDLEAIAGAVRDATAVESGDFALFLQGKNPDLLQAQVAAYIKAVEAKTTPAMIARALGGGKLAFVPRIDRESAVLP